MEIIALKMSVIFVISNNKRKCVTPITHTKITEKSRHFGTYSHILTHILNIPIKWAENIKNVVCCIIYCNLSFYTIEF